MAPYDASFGMRSSLNLGHLVRKHGVVLFWTAA